MDEVNKIVAERLKKLLENHNMSQQELADILGVSQTSVYFWCNGKKIPRMSKIDKIAEYFGVSRAYILGQNKASLPLDISVTGTGALNFIIEVSEALQNEKNAKRIIEYYGKYMKLNNQNKELVDKMIDTLLKNEKEPQE